MLQEHDEAAPAGKPSWLQTYIDSPEKQQSLYRRTLLIVVISQIFGGAGLAAGITVGALLAQEMLGSESFTGVPIALFTLGSAGAALLVGRLSQRFGRRTGLALGFSAGGVGAVGVIIAAATGSVLLLFASLLVYGAGTATNLQARYVGTDLAGPAQRATAVSIAMVSTTFGAVAGPNLVEPLSTLAAGLGVPDLSGPFILAAAAYFMAGIVFFAFLRPDPLVVARAVAAAQAGTGKSSAESVANVPAHKNRGVILGGSIMFLTQMVMIAIMTMTPIHMGHHGHSLSHVGIVIGIHIGSMYFPSLLTGVLVDRIGRTPMAIASGATLLVSAVLAALAPGDSMWVLILALTLLGVGWNFGLISGTALIVDATTPANRAKTQGSVDVLIALAGAFGGALSGLVVAQTSFATLSMIGGTLSLLLIPIVLWARRT